MHRVTVPPPSPYDQPTPATTLAFDFQQELLWIGNEFGRVSAFHGSELRRYISYRGHPVGQGPVKQLLFHDRGVISVAPTSVHLSNRRGLAQWHLVDDRLQDLRCMSYVGKDQSQIVVAGCQPFMAKVSVEKGQIVETVESTEEYEMMKFSKYICAATTTGSVSLLDPDNLRGVNTLVTNNVGICDMDARNHYLVTCGWVRRPPGPPLLAGLANVYDLRAGVQLPPVPFHAGAAHVQMHPKMSTTCILASQTGQLQVVDLMHSGAAVNLRQANVTSYVCGLALAPSGEALAVADADGFVHLWGSPSKLRFAEFGSGAPEWADVPAAVPFLDVNADVPLSTIGMPYYREQLLSAWPHAPISEVGLPPPPIDPRLLKTARPGDIGLWAPNPRTSRRNQVNRSRRTESNGSALAAPKFLSEKARASEDEQAEQQHMDKLNDALGKTALGGVKSDVPLIYRNVEIKYSRFGVDDFDFEFYNKTPYSGLETHIANSYTNPFLQLLRFTPLFRNLALHHAATNCLHETCLLCEMGFLFDMLEKAEGQNCQATNFLKTFSNLPQAGRLGLLEENAQDSALTDMIQAASRFIFTQTADDFRKTMPDGSLFDSTLAIDALTSIRCVNCHNETIREGGSFVTDLEYPNMSSPANRHRGPPANFSQILKSSIELQRQTRGWCDKCRRYQQLATRKEVRGTPAVLLINAALKSNEARQYWAVPNRLPRTLGILVDSGKLFCFEGEELRSRLQKAPTGIKVYDLVGFIADVNSGEHQKSHLVSLIDVNVSERDPSEDSDWHLFNDFLVRQQPPAAALQFFPAWKLPAVLTYQAASGRHAVDDTWRDALDTSLLYQPYSINDRAPAPPFRPLDPETEEPGPGTRAAIDTEFVALQQEEIAITASGEREVVRPTRLGLARVSVLRGDKERPDAALPFISDHITIHEEVVDYLTRWSGVRPGDLDVRSSEYGLVPLKVAYKKLWLLLNRGAVFVGHGLAKDFRTVDLFYSRARQRRLSLRFLAWYLLKLDVQQDTHDSTEDARTALQLLWKFEELQKEGKVESTIEEVYREGKKWGYKPPAEAMAAAGLPATGSEARRTQARSSDGATLGVPGGLVGGADTPDILRGASGPGTPLMGRRTLGGDGSPSRLS